LEVVSIIQNIVTPAAQNVVFVLIGFAILAYSLTKALASHTEWVNKQVTQRTDPLGAWQKQHEDDHRSFSASTRGLEAQVQNLALIVARLDERTKD
jgi:hypothetical protein